MLLLPIGDIGSGNLNFFERWPKLRFFLSYFLQLSIELNIATTKITNAVLDSKGRSTLNTLPQPSTSIYRHTLLQIFESEIVTMDVPGLLDINFTVCHIESKRIQLYFLP